MPVTNIEPDDKTWTVRGVPASLVEKVRETAKAKKINIGKLVEISLRKFFEEQATSDNEIIFETDLNAKIDAKIDAKLRTLNLLEKPGEYLSKLELEEGLLAERQKVHEFDELKNQRREELEEGGISEDRLNEMDEELLEAMPESVRAHVPELAAKEAAPSVKTSFTAKPNSPALSEATSTAQNPPTLIYDPMR